MATILTKQHVINERVENGYTETSYIFKGDALSNLKMESPKIVNGSQRSIKIVNKQWKDSQAYNNLWREAEELQAKIKSKPLNAATFDESDYYSLIDKIRLDITRRRLEEVDYTGRLTNEITNLAFSKTVTLDEFLPFAAPFQEVQGNNDSVSLIEQKYGGTGSVSMKNYAVGWKSTLENLLYNTDIYSLQKVTQAVARGFISLRNYLSVGTMPVLTAGAGFHASQKQAAAATGASTEDNLYITLDNAIEKLANLKDPQTGQTIDISPGIVCLCRPTDVRRINRAINGALNNSKSQTANRTPLTDIAEIWPFRGDTIYYGKKTLSYPGVAANKVYLFVPKTSAYTLVKRPLTQEIGMGSVLNLSTEERAWYFVQNNYLNEFFGSSNATVLAKTGAGYGYVVEVTIP